MKKLKLLFCMVFVVAINIYGQRRYDDASNANLSVGILKNGFAFSLGYEKFLNKQSSFQGEFEYLSKSQELRTHPINAHFADIIIGGKYRRYFTFKGIFPYVSAGAFLGYESLTNKGDIPASVIIDRKNSFIYGVTTDLGLEYSLKIVSFTISANPRYDLNHSEFITSANVGVKFYF